MIRRGVLLTVRVSDWADSGRTMSFSLVVTFCIGFGLSPCVSMAVVGCVLSK